MKKLCGVVFVLEAKKATLSARLSSVVTFLYKYGGRGRKPTHHLKCSDLYGTNVILYVALKVLLPLLLRISDAGVMRVVSRLTGEPYTGRSANYCVQI